MKRVKRLIKITAILIIVAFAGRFVYINMVLPSPFQNELEICLENSKKLMDPLEVEIARELCLDVYPHFN